MFTSSPSLPLYCILLSISIVILAGVLWRFRNNLWAYILVWLAYGTVFVALCWVFKRDGFDCLNLIAIGAFLGGTVLSVAQSAIAWKKFKVFSGFFAFCAVSLAVFTVYAFVIEPYNFEVRYERISTDKISKPIKIGIMADLQTDQIGDYEKMALTRLMNEKPDLILIAGDLIHEFPEHYTQRCKQLNALFKEVHLSAPLGVIVTRGDTDYYANWVDSLEGLPVEIVNTKSRMFEKDELAITGLSLPDSCALGYKLPEYKDKFHIIVGHRPDYSLDTTSGDLLVGGHTHGGQVKIPGFGAPVTISRVPREQAGGGLFETSPGRHLLVTRGVGMERKYAPRLRVFCRPEIVILTVVPAKK